MPDNIEGTLHSITDAKLDQIVKRVTRTVRLAAHKAVAHSIDPRRHPIAADPGSLEQLMLERVRNRKPEQVARAASRTRALLAMGAAERERRFGELGAVDLRSAASVDEQVRAIPVAAALRFGRAHLDRLASEPQLFRGGPAPSPASKAAGGGKLDKLDLRIRKVKCVDETDGFMGSESGDDEIMLGGTSIDESGAAKLIPAYMVGTEFDDNDAVVYSEPRRFTTFDLTEEGNVWPKTYYVTLILCERDNGGFPEWLGKLLDKVKGYVTELVGTAIGAGIGATAGPIGAVVGAVVGAILGALISFFVELWEDDVFPAHTTFASIRSLDHRFASGETTSSERTYAAAAHGGKYQVWFDWRVHT